MRVRTTTGVALSLSAACVPAVAATAAPTQPVQLPAVVVTAQKRR